jgi:hypothetical protein
LLGDDAADQERNQADDRHRPKADELKVMDEAVNAEPRRTPKPIAGRHDDRTEKSHPGRKIPPRILHAAADIGHEFDQRIAAAPRRKRRLADLVVGDGVDENALFGAAAIHHGPAAIAGDFAAQPVEKVRANGIDASHLAEIERYIATGQGLGRAVHHRFEVARMGGGPFAGQPQPMSFAGC